MKINFINMVNVLYFYTLSSVFNKSKQINFTYDNFNNRFM